MEIRRFSIDGREIEFVNQSRGTRSGFAHDTTLFIDGCQRAEHTCHYLNRTWEWYTYQTVMLCAVDDLEDRRTAYLKAEFKRVNGYEKLTAKRKEEFEAVCKKDAELALYKAIKEDLRSRRF